MLMNFPHPDTCDRSLYGFSKKTVNIVCPGVELKCDNNYKENADICVLLTMTKKKNNSIMTSTARLCLTHIYFCLFSFFFHFLLLWDLVGCSAVTEETEI